MNILSLFAVVLRLFSLYFLLIGLMQSAPFIIQMTAKSEGDIYGIISWGVVMANVLISILIWVFAIPISRFATKKLPQEISLGGLGVSDFYSVVFVGIGLFYAVGYCPTTLSWMFFVFKLAASTSGTLWKDEIDGYQLLSAILPFIIGLFFVFQGSRLGNKLAKWHKKLENPNK